MLLDAKSVSATAMPFAEKLKSSCVRHPSRVQQLCTAPQQHLHPQRSRGISSSTACHASAQDQTKGAVLPTPPLSTAAPFLEWARTAGIKFPRLQPAMFDSVRGLSAAAAIDLDDVAISVPRKVAITLSPKQRCPLPAGWLEEKYWGAAPWFVKLALILLYEKSKGTASTFSSYLQQLPQTSDSPVLWEESKLQLLQYPHLINQVKEQQIEWAQLCKDFNAALLPAGVAGLACNEQDLMWGMCIVRSRTFSGPYVASTAADRLRLLSLVAVLAVSNTALGLSDPLTTLSAAITALVFNVLYELILSTRLKQYAMCPLIDFINHSSSVKSEVSYDYFLDQYSVQVCRSYKPGQQVFVSYGTQTNDSLMQFYGFAEDNNPQDVYMMTTLMAWMADGGVLLDAGRLSTLQGSGLMPSVQLVPVARTGFPSETLQALRFLLASDAEVLSAGGVQGFKSDSSEETEQRLLAVLLHACTRELQTLGSSITEDTRLLGEANSAADAVSASLEGGGGSSSRATGGSSSSSSASSKGSGSTGGKGFGGKEAAVGKGKGGAVGVKESGGGVQGKENGMGVMTLEPGGGLRIRERMAILFRLEKKRVLAACCRSLGAPVGDATGASGGQATAALFAAPVLME